MEIENKNKFSHTRQLDYPVTDIQAARYLGLAPQTLRNMRCQRRGPNYLKFGRAIRYRIEDLEDFKNNSLISIQ